MEARNAILGGQVNIASLFKEILQNVDVAFVAGVVHTCETVLLLSIDLVRIIFVFVLALFDQVLENV